MSLQFYNSTDKTGIVDLIYENTKSNTTKYPLKEVTRDVNLALDKAYSIIFQSSGKWQFDDSNHVDYPIITTNLVSGQRDYSFTTDEHSNIILDIYRVLVADENDKFYDLEPVSQQKDGINSIGFVDGQDLEGKPVKYAKTANGIFLDRIPDYNSTGGLKILINREGSYFASTDTTKKPGFAGLFHEYLVLRPSYQYAYRKGMANAPALREEMLLMERKIAEYYGKRSKDEKPRIKPSVRGSL